MGTTSVTTTVNVYSSYGGLRSAYHYCTPARFRMPRLLCPPRGAMSPMQIRCTLPMVPT